MGKRQKKTNKKNQTLCEKVHELDNWSEKKHDEKIDLISLLGMSNRGGILTCGKCGSHNIKNQSVQTRRADEGATLFCLCLDCKHNWKEQQ